VLFAVGAGIAAIPELFVFTETEFAPPKVAAAPVEGAANVTAIPGTGFDAASVTLA
jgi:hypothetical protein